MRPTLKLVLFSFFLLQVSVFAFYSLNDMNYMKRAPPLGFRGRQFMIATQKSKLNRDNNIMNPDDEPDYNLIKKLTQFLL